MKLQNLFLPLRLLRDRLWWSASQCHRNGEIAGVPTPTSSWRTEFCWCLLTVTSILLWKIWRRKYTELLCHLAGKSKELTAINLSPFEDNCIALAIIYQISSRSMVCWKKPYLSVDQTIRKRIISAILNAKFLAFWINRSWTGSQSNDSLKDECLKFFYVFGRLLLHNDDFSITIIPLISFKKNRPKLLYYIKILYVKSPL